MREIKFAAILLTMAVAFGTQTLEAQTQQQGQSVTSLTHGIVGGPISPFFSQATGSDGTVYDFAPIGGISGDLVSGAGDTTNVSGTITIVGTSNASTNFNDGNRLPKGITLTYDLSFTISTTDGDLVTAGGNTGDGLAPGALPFGVFDPGEAIEFSVATISNISFSGTPTDPSVTFTPGTVSAVGLSQFRSNNFAEATEGVTLSNGTDTVGFGTSMGTIANEVAINNGFTAAARFPALGMDVPITLTMDVGEFNLKGIEFTTTFDYEFTSPLSNLNIALTNFSHNINPGPFSPFFTQATGSDGTVYDFTGERGLVGSIVSGAADTTTVSGTVEIVGNATAANDFSNGNRLPQGVTLSYDLSFTVSSPDGLLTTAGGNTGNGIGIGPNQFDAINDGEQLVFSPATISNVAFSGEPVDDVTFVAVDIVDVALTQFRAANFAEAVSGAVLSNGTDSVGFGIATGTLTSNGLMNNGFLANARFPAISMMDQLTLTAEAGTSSFNLKGFELATVFSFETSDTGFLLGDVNQDGSVDFLDIVPFVALLSSNEFLAEGDANQDGFVDFRDIVPFIALLSS